MIEEELFIKFFICYALMTAIFFATSACCMLAAIIMVFDKGIKKILRGAK